jgi:uncharacterized repeat protein (TIGR04138 family)
MQSLTFEEIVTRILKHDARYAREAYDFVREALDATQRKIHKEPRGSRLPEHRHVTGQQLLAGIRDYALRHFGPMTLFVFYEWGVRRCEDFGEIVFNLVDHGNGMFGKTEEDSRDDFKNGYSFQAAFRKPFQPSRRSAKVVKELREA